LIEKIRKFSFEQIKIAELNKKLSEKLELDNKSKVDDQKQTNFLRIKVKKLQVGRIN
jgi:hypothetical protein